MPRLLFEGSWSSGPMRTANNLPHGHSLQSQLMFRGLWEPYVKLLGLELRTAKSQRRCFFTRQQWLRRPFWPSIRRWTWSHFESYKFSVLVNMQEFSCFLLNPTGITGRIGNLSQNYVALWYHASWIFSAQKDCSLASSVAILWLVWMECSARTGKLNCLRTNV